MFSKYLKYYVDFCQDIKYIFVFNLFWKQDP